MRTWSKNLKYRFQTRGRILFVLVKLNLHFIFCAELEKFWCSSYRRPLRVNCTEQQACNEQAYFANYILPHPLCKLHISTPTLQTIYFHAHFANYIFPRRRCLRTHVIFDRKPSRLFARAFGAREGILPLSVFQTIFVKYSQISSDCSN